MKKVFIWFFVLLILIVGWYLVSPIFLENEVNEDFPLANMTEKERDEMVGALAGLEMNLPSVEVMQRMTQEDLDMLEREMVEKSNQMPEKKMDEPLMDETKTEPTLLRSGEFVDADDFHKGEGDVGLYELVDGSKIVRFEGFRVTNGPDLRVILTKKSDPMTRSQVDEGYVELGKLKGNVGNQNYVVPENVDVSEYNGVVIYCKPFHVLFAIASLE